MAIAIQKVHLQRYSLTRIEAVIVQAQEPYGHKLDQAPEAQPTLCGTDGLQPMSTTVLPLGQNQTL